MFSLLFEAGKIRTLILSSSNTIPFAVLPLRL